MSPLFTKIAGKGEKAENQFSPVPTIVSPIQFYRKLLKQKNILGKVCVKLIDITEGQLIDTREGC